MKWNEKIRARRGELNMSQAALGRAVGISQAAINKIEKGDVEHTRKLSLIARELGIPLVELDATLVGMERNEIVPLGPLPEESRDEKDHVPVYSSVEGGPGEMVRDKEPIDYAPRPHSLKGIADGYIVLVSGDSMYPEYRPGDQLIIHPRQPIVPDASFVFYTANGDDDLAMVKHLIRITPTEWVVEQYNPGITFTLPRADWPIAHRVVGKNNRR